jgi:serine protease Do
MSKSLVLATAVSALILLVAPKGSQGQDREIPGQSRAAFLGIAAEPTPEGARHEGAIVREVMPNSPATKAGLKLGDVITRVGKKEVRDFEDLANLMSQHKAGDKLSLHVMRGGQEKDLTVTLGRRPRGRLPEGEDDSTPNYYGRRKPTAFLGVQTQELTSELRKREGLSAQQGAVVEEVFANTPAEQAGLQEGDVITKVDDQPISNPEELRAAIQNAGPGREVTIDVVRGKKHRELNAHLQESPVEFGISYGAFPNDASRELQKLRQRIQQLEQRIRKLEQNRPTESSK